MLRVVHVGHVLGLLRIVRVACTCVVWVWGWRA